LGTAHVLLWFIGLAGIRLGAGRLRKSEKARLQMVDQIRTLSYAVEQNPASIVIADTNGKIEYVNSAFTQTTGYELEKIRGKRISIIKSNIHPPEFYKEMWKTVTSGKTWIGDICNRGQKGDLLWEYLSVSPIKNSKGEITNIVSVKMDDTERKRAKEALWKSEEKFRSISASAQDAIIMKDNDGNISFWNNAAEMIFGYTESEALGKNLHMLLSPKRYHEKNLPAFNEFRKTGQGSLIGTTVEVEAIKKDGSEFPIELSISAVQLDGLWSSIGIIRDMTERKRAEEDLRQAKEVAEDANRSKSEFLATMSHELRTPLNAIIGFSKVLLEGVVGELNKEQKKDVNYILSGGNQLLNLVNDILDISKIEAGKLIIENELLNLNDIIDNVINIVSLPAEKKSLTLDVEYGNDSPLNIFGDAARLQQVILNFVSNAVKFTDNGLVFIKIECRENKENDAIVKVSVKDSGIGIAKEELENIFEKFTQADSSTTRKYGGTGLGLAISKKLVELMGGTIDVSSQPGEGSTFWFELPLKLMNSPAPTEKASEVSENDRIQKRCKERIERVLVVDDNQPNQEIAHRMLNAMGCHVDAVGSGKEAIERVGKISYDLVFMDCQMPGMDGYETTTEIRKSGNNSENLPIIAMTAKAMEGDREKCLEAGMDDYISKPLSLEGLISILNRWGNHSGA
ncbi:MAG: PAS domain S-box protein, partial [Proteobacteria bacterium]|nr:PAS domain S-box protein [Pseudomonadota bacterium]